MKVMTHGSKKGIKELRFAPHVLKQLLVWMKELHYWTSQPDSTTQEIL
jgi:hypothetical protein